MFRSWPWRGSGPGYGQAEKELHIRARKNQKLNMDTVQFGASLLDPVHSCLVLDPVCSCRASKVSFQGSVILVVHLLVLGFGTIDGYPCGGMISLIGGR